MDKQSKARRSGCKVKRSHCRYDAAHTMDEVIFVESKRNSFIHRRERGLTDEHSIEGWHYTRAIMTVSGATIKQLDSGRRIPISSGGSSTSRRGRCGEPYEQQFKQAHECNLWTTSNIITVKFGPWSPVTTDKYKGTGARMIRRKKSLMG